MQYTVCGFQQNVAVDIKFDCSDIVMLRWLVDFFNTSKMTNKVINHRIFFWVNYQTVIDELPILGITSTEIIARRFSKWEKAGLVCKLLVKGADEYICNGHNGTRNGTFTYFSFDPNLLAELLGDRPKGRALSEEAEEGGGLGVEQGPTQRSNGGLPESRTKDPSPKNSSTKNHSTSAHSGEIIFSDGDWTYYSDETASYMGEERISIRTRMSLPPQVQSWLDAKYTQTQQQGKARR